MLEIMLGINSPRLAGLGTPPGEGNDSGVSSAYAPLLFQNISVKIKTQI
jgi:hypothetical protein